MQAVYIYLIFVNHAFCICIATAFHNNLKKGEGLEN